MTDPAPTWAELLELVSSLDASHYREVSLDLPGLRLRMSTDPHAFSDTAPVRPATAAPVAAPATATLVTPAPQVAAPAAQAAPAAPGHEVTAPFIGVFYARPSPEAPPFVGVGDRVEADTTVAIVEVMKLMNTITAGAAGVVAEVLAKDGETVEFGQPLLRISPATADAAASPTSGPAANRADTGVP